MTDELEVLPSTPGIYRVQTWSGTVYIICLDGVGMAWERCPAADTRVVDSYDFQPVPVILTNEDGKIGGVGALTVCDETYLTWPTRHQTGTIISITGLMPE